MKQEELYKKAIQKWGLNSQLGMFYEELGELITALNKFTRDVNGCSLEKVAEEIADVEIMIEQFQVMSSLKRKTIDSIKEKKINKLRGMLQ